MGKNKKATFDRIDISATRWPQEDPDYNYKMTFRGIGYGHFNEDEFEDGTFPDDASKKVGHITGWCFDFSETTIPIHDILDEDSDSSPLMEIYGSYGSYEIRKDVCKVLDTEEFEINPYRLMLFHVLYIDPKFRGNNFSNYFFFETIKTLGGGIDLFGGDVSPLQIVGWGKKDDYDLKQFDEFDEATSKKKLIEHYTKLGFRELPNSTVVVATEDHLYRAMQKR